MLRRVLIAYGVLCLIGAAILLAVHATTIALVIYLIINGLLITGAFFSSEAVTVSLQIERMEIGSPRASASMILRQDGQWRYSTTRKLVSGTIASQILRIDLQRVTYLFDHPTPNGVS